LRNWVCAEVDLDDLAESLGHCRDRVRIVLRRSNIHVEQLRDELVDGRFGGSEYSTEGRDDTQALKRNGVSSAKQSLYRSPQERLFVGRGRPHTSQQFSRKRPDQIWRPVLPRIQPKWTWALAGGCAVFRSGVDAP
jgi:hypothetical protein